MYAWIIAHNLGFFLLMAPICGVAYGIIKIEDFLKKVLTK